MTRLFFKIIKESEVSIDRIRDWSEKSPMKRHEAFLQKFLQHDEDFQKDLKENKFLFGLLGGQIGEFILQDDFILYRGVEKGYFSGFIEKEAILLGSLFLLNLLSKEDYVTITSNERIGTTSEEFLSKKLTRKWKHSDHFWIKNTLYYGPFSYTFDPSKYEEMIARYIQEEYERTGVRIKKVLNLPLRFLISEINPNQLSEYKKWLNIFQKRREFNILSSFLAKNLLIDANEFLAKNKELFDLRLDEWGIPRKNSSYYNQARIFAIDYKSLHITCIDHGKYHSPAMYPEQRKYVGSLLGTEVGVLILSLQFCDCGRIFYKYIEPKIKNG